LVFDLDADDYKDHLPSSWTTPQSTTTVTPDTASSIHLTDDIWTFLVFSGRLLDLFLRHAVLPVAASSDHYRSFAVFSGRRGLHLWVPSHSRDWYNSETFLNYILDAISNLTQDPVAGSNSLISLLRTTTNDAGDILQEIESWWRQHTHGEDAAISLTDIIQRLLPRIDIGVTRDYRHLLKCPFSIHPKTHAISLPFPLYGTHILWIFSS
jgi:DNA primase catalytic subunit